MPHGPKLTTYHLKLCILALTLIAPRRFLYEAVYNPLRFPPHPTRTRHFDYHHYTLYHYKAPEYLKFFFFFGLMLLFFIFLFCENKKK